MSGGRGRRRHRPGYVTVHSDGVQALHGQDVRPEVRWTLLELVMRADFRTHEVRGSLAWLAEDLGVDRKTLRAHLRELERHGWVRVEPGPNQRIPTTIRLPGWSLFTGEVGDDTMPGEVVGEVVGELGGENFPNQAPSDLRKRAPENFQNIQNIQKNKSLARAQLAQAPELVGLLGEDWPHLTPLPASVLLELARAETPLAASELQDRLAGRRAAAGRRPYRLGSIEGTLRALAASGLVEHRRGEGWSVSAGGWEALAPAIAATRAGERRS